jgi:hypothetical protein
MDPGIIALFVSGLLGFGGAAWFYVIRWTLLRKMEQLEAKTGDVVTLENRLDALEKRPEPGLEQYKQILLRFENNESELRLLHRKNANSEESLRSLIGKHAARAKRISEGAEDVFKPEPGIPTLEELKAAGVAVPLVEESEPPRRNRRADFGQIPISIGG